MGCHMHVIPSNHERMKRKKSVIPVIFKSSKCGRKVFKGAKIEVNIALDCI
jgi:hypothetical protein